MKKILLFTIYYFIIFPHINAQESGGIWLPNQLNGKEMKQMGMKISEKDIFDISRPSIKDAVALFGGGCSSGIISTQGLLLTNYHCGQGQIQSHSTIENNLLTQGFWAKDYSEELPNKELTATFTVNITDVTSQILLNISENISEEQRNELIKVNSKKVADSFPKENYQEIIIKPFYNNNKYYAIVTETFKDIRLVGAPPSAIGNFGSNTDNWTWPRHSGDFAIFRIYADKNNKPAEYSENNVPYIPKYSLPISIKSKKNGDFSFVYGFPGVTKEYLPSYALTEIIEIINPARITLREATLNTLDKKMRADNATKIKYTSKYASIANGWKKWIGENQGLKKSNAIQKKREYETQFIQYLNNNPKVQEKHKHILPDFNSIYKTSGKYTKASTYFNEVFYSNSETFRMAIFMIQLMNSPSERFSELKNKLRGRISGIYKNYDADLDRMVSVQLIHLYSKNIDPEFQPPQYTNYNQIDHTDKIISDLWENSIISGKNGDLTELLSSDDKDSIINQLKTDPIIQFVQAYYDIYVNNIYPEYSTAQSTLENLQQLYMKAQLEAFPNKKFFPDANSTLRITYGKIEGYQSKDAVYYSAFTSLDGVMEKYIPEDYEFNVPEKLINLYNQKDYGKYGYMGKLPVNYIATNHTTGGNSGSPAFDAHGNLVGLNFDRVWEGTMSDLNYDPAICRNIMVDSRYILYIIEQYAGSEHIMKELKIIEY